MNVRRTMLLVVLVGVSFGANGCEKQDRDLVGSQGPAPVCSCAPGTPVVDPALLAFLSVARVAHHEADLAEDAKEPLRAIAALERLIKAPHPGGASPSIEIAEVLADARARLADLRSQGGDIEQALGDIKEGLALATEPTHFRGHLFEVQGIVLKRKAAVLKQKGDDRGAEMAKEAAITAFGEATKIQLEVIESTLPDAGANGGSKP